MINFYLKEYFSLRSKRWRNIIIFLCFFAILLKYIALSDVLPQNKPLILIDYIFGAFSYPAYIVFVVPLTYCYLLYDIITKDYEGGYIAFILPRIKNRVSYFISKVILIVIIANIYFFVNLIIFFVIGLLFRLPFHGQCYFEPLKVWKSLRLNVFGIFVLQYSIYCIGLITFGIIILVISMIFNNGIYSFVFTVMCAIQGHEAFFNNNKNLKWSLIGQLALSKHYPFIQGNNNYLSNYNIFYSIKFYMIIFVMIFLLGMFYINKVNFSKKV